MNLGSNWGRTTVTACYLAFYQKKWPQMGPYSSILSTKLRLLEKGVDMPRASRHYVPGCIWHITHRCHNKDFLFNILRDRKRWKMWLFEARRRFDLIVLNYRINFNRTSPNFPPIMDIFPLSLSFQGEGKSPPRRRLGGEVQFGHNP